MNYELYIEKSAEKDIDEAFFWYELQKDGLGLKFIETLSTSFNKILEHPLAYPKVYRKIRRLINRRFPYSIFFKIDGVHIRIIAVFHNKRNPKIWFNRN